MVQIPKWLLISFVLVSFTGFLDSSFLSLEHYNRGILPCYIFSGCDEVTASRYATVAGVPISLAGATFYLSILIAAIFYLDTKNAKALKILKFLPAVGFLASLWLLFLQFFIIKAICFYCILSLVSSTMLFILGLYLFVLLKKDRKREWDGKIV
ncbi:MAG: vitamin K epoxide reductase family protein [Candidatus Yanofskybacteria bacterium]|nr:vitamin K epoxide reductase family protein [Candidatus Yanofskybacteria bacterium]